MAAMWTGSDMRRVYRQRCASAAEGVYVVARFPVANGLRFLKFAGESGLRMHVQPKCEVRAQGHRVQAADVIAIDAAHYAARDQREDEAVGKHDGAGTQRRQDAMLDLIEKVRRVH